MAYGDANAVAMEIGEFEVLPVVEEIPVFCGVHGSDPRRRMWHFLQQVKAMGFSGVNNFPTHSIVDGNFRDILEETGMGFYKEVEMVRIASEMDLFSCVYVATPEEAIQMAEVGADAIIAHVEIIEAGRKINKDILFLAHGGPINTPDDVKVILANTDAHGFVGASSLERMAVESSLTALTQDFKSLKL